MRRLAILFVLAGCNKIFGLDELRELDAGGNPDALRFHLVHQIASTSNGGPGVIATPVLEEAPVPAGTIVRVQSDDKLLADTIYNAETGEVDILISEPFTKRWLVEYTLPGQAPRQVSWNPDGVNAVLAVPVIGRLDRGDPMPAGAAIDIQPTGTNPAPPAPGTFTSSHIFTTGVFIDVATGTTPNNAKLDQLSTRFDGPSLGSPDGERGDHAILVDYKVDGADPCSVTARGYAGFPPPKLVAGPVAPQPQPIWQVPPITAMKFNYANLGPLGLEMRMNGALGTRVGGSGSSLEFGFTANDQIFGFSGPPKGSPSPLMFVLAICTLNAVAGDVVIPTDLEKFPLLAYGRFISGRMSDGVALVSSIVTLGLKPNDSDDVAVDFGVPFVVGATLIDGPNSLALTGDTDNIALGGGMGTVELALELEPTVAGVSLELDYLEIVVMELEGLALAEARHYLTTDLALQPGTRKLMNTITIDRNLFVPGHRYVLAISAVRGVPDARIGHFDSVSYPHAISTIFTRTILVQADS